MPFIELDDRRLTYNIKTMKRKDIALKIDNNNLQVITPKNKLTEMNNFLFNKKDWINNYIDKEGIFLLGGHILHLGYKKPLTVAINKDEKNERMELTDDTFIIFAQNEGDYTLKKIITQWLKKEAYDLISQRIEKYKLIIGVKPNKVEIDKLFNRWASCSNFGNMKFHYKCAMLPKQIIDYVVVHELCHLHYFSHSKEYWDLVDKIMPDYLIHKEWLEEHGKIIMQ